MLTKVIDLIFRYAEVRQDTKSQMRLIYLECIRNLDLLDAIRIDSITAGPLSPPARKLVSQLDISTLLIVFSIGIESDKLRAEFSKIRPPVIDGTKSTPKSLLVVCKSLVSSVSGITILADAWTEKAHDCKTIRFKKRLENILLSLRYLQKALAVQSCVKDVFIAGK